jgi:hypothetical protein
VKIIHILALEHDRFVTTTNNHISLGFLSAPVLLPLVFSKPEQREEKNTNRWRGVERPGEACSDGLGLT